MNSSVDPFRLTINPKFPFLLNLQLNRLLTLNVSSFIYFGLDDGAYIQSEGVDITILRRGVSLAYKFAKYYVKLFAQRDQNISIKE